MAKQDNNARDAIKAYLDSRAAGDPLFAKSYAKEGKNLDECFSYILGEAQKRGTRVCMTDEEVFSLAVHYYDEDDIKVAPTPARYRAATSANAPVKLSDEEKAATKAKVLELYQQECLRQEAQKARSAQKKTNRPPAITEYPSLFD